MPEALSPEGPKKEIEDESATDVKETMGGSPIVAHSGGERQEPKHFFFLHSFGL
jgi:hypothetical protein